MGQQVKLYIACATDLNMDLGFCRLTAIFCVVRSDKSPFMVTLFSKMGCGIRPLPIYCPLQESDLQTPPTLDLPSFPGNSAHTSLDTGEPKETCVGPVTDQTNKAQVPEGLSLE